MEELNLSLDQIDNLIMELYRMRNQIVESLPTSIDEDWQEELADAYENAKKDYKFPKVA
ncbi:MAG: hypothetical protein K0Q49_2584 [Haloplasmataceae bacterium]|jgi:hypothetical protein|nr:hypothetical protein [Haloplasmataceae bacterium]